MKKERVFRIIQIGNKGDLPSQSFDIFITLVIITNIVVMILDTYESFKPYENILNIINTITLFVFTIEYILRIWTADLLYPELSKTKAVGKFLISYDGIVDLLTIIPWIFLSGFVAFRILRIIRIFHLFRINNQYDSFAVIFAVLREKRNQILSSMVIVMILMLASSIGIYYAEHNYSDKFENAFSGIWWSVSTLLTVGYGDIYPVTTPGRIMAIATAFLGVGVVAIPTGIISAGFVEHYSRVNLLSKFARDENIDMLTVNVTDGHCWNGLTISQIHAPEHFAPAVVIRDGEALVPISELKLKKGDAVILAADVYFLQT